MQTDLRADLWTKYAGRFRLTMKKYEHKSTLHQFATTYGRQFVTKFDAPDDSGTWRIVGVTQYDEVKSVIYWEREVEEPKPIMEPGLWPSKEQSEELLARLKDTKTVVYKWFVIWKEETKKTNQG